jgi:hypothetical protein
MKYNLAFLSHLYHIKKENCTPRLSAVAYHVVQQLGQLDKRVYRLSFQLTTQTLIFWGHRKVILRGVYPIGYQSCIRLPLLMGLETSFPLANPSFGNYRCRTVEGPRNDDLNQINELYYANSIAYPQYLSSTFTLCYL